MAGVEHPLKVEVEALRTIIKNASPKLTERVKWNAPSYFYKEDLAAFNLRQQKFVQLILLFPKGLVADENNIMQGDWKDRREVRFTDMADVKAKQKSLEKIIQDWVALIEQPA